MVNLEQAPLLLSALVFKQSDVILSNPDLYTVQSSLVGSSHFCRAPFRPPAQTQRGLASVE